MDIIANDHNGYLEGLLTVVKKMNIHQTANGFSLLLATYARLQRGDDLNAVMDDFVAICERHLGISRIGDNIVIDALKPTAKPSIIPMHVANDPQAH